MSFEALMNSNKTAAALVFATLSPMANVQAEIAISADGIVVSAPLVQSGEICVNSLNTCEVSQTIAGGWWLEREMKRGDIAFFVDSSESTRRLVEAKSFTATAGEGWDKLLFTGLGAFIGLLTNFILQFVMQRSRENEDSREKIRAWRTLMLASVERWRLKEDVLIEVPELPSLNVRDLKRVEVVRKALYTTQNKEEIQGIDRYILADEMRETVIHLRSSERLQINPSS